jgi:hypothetical protein
VRSRSDSIRAAVRPTQIAGHGAPVTFAIFSVRGCEQASSLFPDHDRRITISMHTTAAVVVPAIVNDKCLFDPQSAMVDDGHLGLSRPIRSL